MTETKPPTSPTSDTCHEDAVKEPLPWLPGDTPLRRLPDELLPGQPSGVAGRRLGRQVRAWREARGISQQELAARLGMAQPNLARLEGGGVAPTLTTLALLAERLGVRVTVMPGPDGPEVLVEDALPAA
jgi:DNA-binding XRE family transcriptional regulator